MSSWTYAHQSLLETFASIFPVPASNPPAGSNNDACRDWTRRAAEQFAFTFPGEGWGHKRADSGRPPSTDVIATRSPFLGYDLILNQGAIDGSQRLNDNPSPLNLAGQTFIDVTPTNHIGGVVTPPPPPPPTDLEARVAKLEAWARSFK